MNGLLEIKEHNHKSLRIRYYHNKQHHGDLSVSLCFASFEPSLRVWQQCNRQNEWMEPDGVSENHLRFLSKSAHAPDQPACEANASMRAEA